MSTTEVANPPSIVRINARDADIDDILKVLDRDGGIIIENFIDPSAAAQIRADLKPYFESDTGDVSGFFPKTTRRAIGLLGISDACVDLALNPILTEVASRLLTSTYEYWVGQERHTAVSKPQISSTVGFQVNPGGKQQGLHRDEIDYHTAPGATPMMLGAVTAVVKTTKANGATIAIPGSHKWGDERTPFDHEAVPAELNPGDTFLFLGGTYHAGGANSTTDEARETVGIFLCKGMYRQVENQYFMVPPEKAKRLSAKAQRLLGYAISPPFCGFVNYKDPMEEIFGVNDAETIKI
ncbi:phytanoyl-CoA dioxygenase family protein [Cladophialophora carrionii]|uniref:Phytanoyl-CoA dioxygenase family protein n=1 Tax=Cladophialophora carrionii TaxID=86049 RepID=A0A1C1CUR5_9EURO|nr:phytanoyl-CoA dioxygenase family protein [Cladophialophora carrionii]